MITEAVSPKSSGTRSRKWYLNYYIALNVILLNQI